ncbi:MAG: NAD(+) synthase [Flexilinea sp.]
MRYGFIKTAACTPEIKTADCRFNAGQIWNLMETQASGGVHVLVLPELCLTGYTCGDLFLQETLIKTAEDELIELCKRSQNLPMISIIGLPLVHHFKLYNCAAVVYKGKILGIVPKTEIPNYAEFYELRHFSPAPETCDTIKIGEFEIPFGNKLIFSCEEMPEFIFGVEICEDLWVAQPPSSRHVQAGATLIANLSASDEVIGKAEFRRQLVKGQSARLICAYIYTDAGRGESTTDLVFSGHNLIAQNGTILSESKPFESGRTITEIDLQELVFERRKLNTFHIGNSNDYTVVPFSMPLTKTILTRKIQMNPFVPDDPSRLKERCELILSIQSAGLRQRLSYIRAKSAVIGISGGLDSTLALLVSARAMKEFGHPMSDIIAVTMPSFGTSDRTKSNAMKICDALGVTLRVIDITETVRSHFRDIGHSETDHSVLFENAQARERTRVLMDICHQTDGIVIGTGDLSELALGWATYNGDHMSMYGVNGSIPKTLVRFLVRYCMDNTENSVLKQGLEDILATPVSPELLPLRDGKIVQCTEDLVGPYELHDFFLYYMIRRGFAPRKIKYLAEIAFTGVYDSETIQKWLQLFYKRFFAQQFKRSCLPDGPKVGTVTLSPRGDWRMPSDGSPAAWLEDLKNS